MKALLLFILLLITGFVSNALAQRGGVQGVIITVDSFQAAGVTVQVKEYKKITQTGENGFYQINNLPAGTYTLLFSSLGDTREEKVAVGENGFTELNLLLAQNARQLKEVMVIGYKGLNDDEAAIGKLPARLFDLPQSIVTIDQQVLERQQTLKLSDVLQNISGIYVMGTTGGNQEELAGRGYAYNSSNTFKNGVRYNNGILPEMSAFEKVEVIKGSTAVLYGNVTASGAINLVTKKPLFEKGGAVSMRAGSYHFYKPSIDIFGAINGSKKAAYRINTSYQTAGSFRDQVNSQRFYINPSFLYKLSAKTELLLEGDYLKDEHTPDYGTGAINYTIAAVPRNRFIGVAWGLAETTQGGATATLLHQLANGWLIKAVTGVQQYQADVFGTTRPNASGQFIKPGGKWIRGLQRSGANEKYVITQVDVTGAVKTGRFIHTVLLGADADRYLTKATAYNNLSRYDSVNVFDENLYLQRQDIPALLQNTITTSPINRLGLYVQDLVTITPNLKLLAGLRYSRQSNREATVDSVQKTGVALLPAIPTMPSAPRFGLVYQPVKNIALFASYSNSFTVNTGLDVNNQPLPPSLINQYEAGIKNNLLKGFLSANLTVYKIVNAAFAQAVINPPLTAPAARELAGEVTSKGLEVDIQSKPYHGFSLIAGYSYNDTRYTKSNIYIKNSRLRYNPNHTANTSLYYTFSQKTFLKGANAGAGIFYTGDRVGGRSTRLTTPNDTYRLMPVPGFVLLDFSAGYTLDNVSLRLKVSNVTDRLSYYVHDDNSINPIAPRQLSATVSLKL